MIFKVANNRFRWNIFILSGFSFTDTDDPQNSRRRERTIFYSTTTFTRSRTFRYLFATLHVRRLSRISNRNTCIYQAATRWDLPSCRITIWFIDDVTLIFVCLLDDLILAFLLQQFKIGNQWTQTRIDYHRCITSEQTSQLLPLYYKWTD